MIGDSPQKVEQYGKENDNNDADEAPARHLSVIYAHQYESDAPNPQVILLLAEIRGLQKPFLNFRRARLIPRPGTAIDQIFINKVLNISVQYAVGIGCFMFGAMVFYHSIRMKHVRSYLAAPAYIQF